MVGTFMGPLDGTIANVAVAPISRSFGVPIDQTEWVLLSYLLVLATFLIPFGRLGDLIGHKRVYLAGFGVFGLGSLACGIVPGLWSLVVARVVQGVGASLLQSVGGALVVATTSPAYRGRALGINGASVALGLALGPFVGGLLIATVGWRWVFFINVPIAIVAWALAARVLPPSPTTPNERFDLPGASLVGLTLFLFALALSRAHVWGWTSPPVIALLAAVPVLAAAFIAIEARVPAPTVDLAMFRNRIFAFSVIAAVLNFSCQYQIFFTVPLVLQSSLGESALTAGLVLVPMAVIVMVLAPIAGSLSDRISARYLSSFGAALTGIGGLLLAFAPARPSALDVAVRLLIVGCGIGLFNQPNNASIMGNVERRRYGIAAAMLASARQVGIVLGISVAGAIYFFAATHLAAPQEHTIAPARPVFLCVFAVSIVTVVFSYARGNRVPVEAEVHG